MFRPTLLRARLKRLGVALRNLPLRLAIYGAIACVDAFTAGGIAATNHETFTLFNVTVGLAALEIGFCFLSGLLSVQGSMTVAELKADSRPEQRARAGSARTASVSLLLIPIVFFASALAVPVQRAERQEYVTSHAYKVDMATAEGRCLTPPADGECYIDPPTREAARASLERAKEITTAKIDGTWVLCFLAAAFVYGALNWSGSAFYLPRPETPWEAKERANAERTAKREATKAANKAKLVAEERRAKSRWPFDGFFKKAETRFVSPDAER